MCQRVPFATDVCFSVNRFKKRRKQWSSLICYVCHEKQNLMGGTTEAKFKSNSKTVRVGRYFSRVFGLAKQETWLAGCFFFCLFVCLFFVSSLKQRNIGALPWSSGNKSETQTIMGSIFAERRLVSSLRESCDCSWRCSKWSFCFGLNRATVSSSQSKDSRVKQSERLSKMCLRCVFFSVEIHTHKSEHTQGPKVTELTMEESEQNVDVNIDQQPIRLTPWDWWLAYENVGILHSFVQKVTTKLGWTVVQKTQLESSPPQIIVHVCWSCDVAAQILAFHLQNGRTKVVRRMFLRVWTANCVDEVSALGRGLTVRVVCGAKELTQLVRRSILTAGGGVLRRAMGMCSRGLVLWPRVKLQHARQNSRKNK